MLRRLIPWLSALIAFVVVGLSVASYEADIAWRHAKGMSDLCYLNHGFPPGSRPTSSIAACTEPIFRNSQATWFYFAGAGAGLIAALIVLGVFVFFRRKRSAA